MRSVIKAFHLLVVVLRRALRARALALRSVIAWFAVACLLPINVKATEWQDDLRPVVESLVQQHNTASSTSSAINNTTPRNPLRVEVEVGRLDERLRLAPCTKIVPQWPAGQRPWGRIRVALRCAQGPTPWKVYLPVTVKLWGQALVAAEALPAATKLEARHLTTREVDFASGSLEMPLGAGNNVADRVLAKPLAAGAALRASDLRTRQWFAVGDVVRVVALGDGYQIDAEATALDAGIEGKSARVRCESGRVLVGRAAGERRIEVRP